MGANEYLISRTGASFTGMGELKANAIRDANEYCGFSKKVIAVQGLKETPMSVGVYPQVEVNFSCN